MGDTHRNTDECREQNADKQAALNFFDDKYGRNDDPYHTQQRIAVRKIADGYERAFVGDDDTAIYQPYESNEQPYAYADGLPQGRGDCVDNGLP